MRSTRASGQWLNDDIYATVLLFSPPPKKRARKRFQGSLNRCGETGVFIVADEEARWRKTNSRFPVSCW